MTVKLKNNVYGYLANAVSGSDTGLVLTSASLFPALGAGEYFYATIVGTNNALEVVKCTAVGGNTLTVVRAQEGTTAQTFPSGSRVEMRITAQSIYDAITDAGGGDADVLRADLASTAAGKGSSLVGYRPAGTTGISTTRTVQDKLRESVSVLDFGADRTGVADSSVAIQNAVNSGAKNVYVPAGTYLMNYPVEVPYNVSIHGDGVGATKLQAGTGISANFSFLDFSGSSPSGKQGLLNFLPGQIPLQISNPTSNLAFGDVDITFTSAHGLIPGDIITLIDRGSVVLVESVSGTFQVGETLTGGSTGATGTIYAVDVRGTNAYIYVHSVSGAFRPYYGGSSSTETVTGGTSGATGTTTLFGGSFNPSRRGYNAGEMLVVSDASSATTIRVNGQVTHTYNTAAMEVWKIRQPTNSTLRDISVIGAREETVYPYGVVFVYGSNCLMENVEVSRFFYTNVELHLCHSARVNNCYVHQDFDYDPTAGSDYYAIVLANSYNSQIRNSTLMATRHAVTVGGYSYVTALPNIVDTYPTISGCLLTASGAIQAADFHGNTSRGYYKDNVIQGGFDFGGEAHVFDGNEIYGIGTSQSSMGMYASELCSTEHRVINNRFVGKGTINTGTNGFLFFYTGVKKGQCKGGAPFEFRGNRVVLEGGTGSASLWRMTDTCGVGFTSGFTCIIEDNNFYNDNVNGIHAYTTDVLPIEKLIVRNNIWRGASYAVSFGRVSVKHGTYNGNWIERTGAGVNHRNVALRAAGGETVECVGNTIKRATAGAIAVETSNAQTQPAIVQNNIIWDYGYENSSSSSGENAAISTYRDSGGTSQTQFLLIDNEVLSAQSTAQSGLRYSGSTTNIIRNLKFRFSAPGGPNWVSFFYGSSPATYEWDSIDAANVSVGSSTGAAGYGVDFSRTPNAAGMTSQMLDDYEIGSWTASYGASTATGKYVKIGRLVQIYVTIQASSESFTQITGLPFTTDNDGYSGGFWGKQEQCDILDASGVPCSIVVSGTSILFFNNTTTGSPTAFTVTTGAGTVRVGLTAVYRASA